MAELTLNVPDIGCDHCKQAIEGEVSGVEGTERVEVDVGAKQVIVGGDVSREAIVAAIGRAGYAIAD